MWPCCGPSRPCSHQWPPTRRVFRLVSKLATGGKRVLAPLRTARAEVREHVWKLAGDGAPDAGGQVIVHVDGVLVPAHSETQDATATWQKTFGHHPLTGFVDHGRGGSVEYSVGMTITDAIHHAVLKVPASAWTPAVEPDGDIRDGAWVAELAGDCLTGWPNGLRLIVREERPHPGTQLRFTDTDADADADGMRLTCFATNTAAKPIAALELRHRQRARAEDRIRAARATGLRNLPPHDTAQNQIWLEIIQIALDLLAGMPLLALTGTVRLWEPRRLRLRLFSTAAQLVTTGRRRILRLAGHRPWTDVITDALDRLHALSNPGCPALSVPARSTSPPEPWNPAPTRRDSRARNLPRLRNHHQHPPQRVRQQADRIVIFMLERLDAGSGWSGIGPGGGVARRTSERYHLVGRGMTLVFVRAEDSEEGMREHGQGDPAGLLDPPP